MQEAIELALEDLRPFLQADGFDLSLEDLSPSGNLIICLEATPEACLDCLVPDDMLMQIIDKGIRRHAADVRSISLVKRGFDGMGAH